MKTLTTTCDACGIDCSKDHVTIKVNPWSSFGSVDVDLCTGCAPRIRGAISRELIEISTAIVAEREAKRAEADGTKTNAKKLAGAIAGQNSKDSVQDPRH